MGGARRRTLRDFELVWALPPPLFRTLPRRPRASVSTRYFAGRGTALLVLVLPPEFQFCLLDIDPRLRSVFGGPPIPRKIPRPVRRDLVRRWDVPGSAVTPK